MRILTRLRSYCSPFVFRLIIIACIGAPALVHAQIQGNYTIDSRQPTANRNFQTFTDAIIFMANGIDGAVTFDVAPGSGPYNEQLFLNYRLNTSVTKTLTFNCNGVTLTFLSTNSLARAGIKLDSIDYVTFDNLVIVPTATAITEYGVGVHIVHDADHNTIRNCTILNGVNTSQPQNNEGIVLNGSDDFASSQGASNCDSNLIINNTIKGGFTGVTMSSVPIYPEPAVLMKGNQVLNNKISGFWNSGLYLFYNDNTLVQGNDITNAHVLSDATGITLFETNTNMKVIGNRIHNFVGDPSDPNPALRGINLGSPVATAATVNLIANNLIYDFQSAGAQYGISTSSGAYLNIYHNTIALDNHAYTGSGLTYGMFFDGFTDFNMLNNIVTISRTTSGKNVGLYLSQAITRFTSERNLLYLPSGSSSANAVGNYSGTQTTLTDWRTKTGRDLLSVSSDPQYVDPVNFNLIPNDKSIDNMGTYVGINNDFAGAVRNNQHPDIGAYEFLTPACVGPAVGGNATMLPGMPVCEGSPMALNLAGNSFGTGQTYQWQTSSTINGTYTNLGQALAHPAYSTPAVSTLYYRAAVTCGSQVEYSVPILVNVSPSLAAATYTINNTQATGGTNFQSYNDALNAIRCGIRGPVVFNVAAGTGPYREQLIIPQINGSSATNTVTFNGNGTTLTYLSTNTNERAVLKLNGARYFIFDNLNIVAEATGSGQYGVGVQLLNEADHNTVKNCTINLSTTSTSTDLIGVVIDPLANKYTDVSAPNYCDSNTITGNTIIGGQYAITCTSSPAVLSQGNAITKNTIKDFRQYGIYIAGTNNTLVEGNDLSRPTRTNNGSTLYAIYSAGTHKNLSISKNKIHNPWDGAKTATTSFYGIINDGNLSNLAEPIIVSNNLIYNFYGAGPQTGLYNIGSDSIQYYHNTISLEDPATNTQTTRGFYQSGEAHGILFKNNNIVIKRGGTGAKHCIYINTAATTFESNYNNFYNGSTGGTKNFIGYVKSKDYATVALWQPASLNDANTISVYPNFQDPANADFTPTLLDMDNKGIPVGISTDINGVTRHPKPDIGAFEFSICLSLTKPVVSVSNATTSEVDFSWPAVTNATGYLVSTDGSTFVTPSSGATGLTHIVSNVLAGTDVSLTVIALGTTTDCPGDTSDKVTGRTLCLQLGAGPNAKIDTVTTNSVRFSWLAVTNATSYKVSTDGVNYVTPSSGPTGLYHIITGLAAGTTINFTVQAQGTSVNCPTATSTPLTARTLNNKYFVPNAFTPNGNGKSDVFKIESSEIASLRLMIFNQWGEKIFESNSQQNGWDGTYKGKQQPVGVYVYALSMTMTDGSVVNKKGTITLIR